MRVEFAPEAVEEYREAHAFYLGHSADAAEGFRREVIRLTQRLSEHPHSGQSFTEDLRRAQLVRYPFAVFYGVDAANDRLVIARIIHARRSPTSWPGAPQ